MLYEVESRSLLEVAGKQRVEGYIIFKQSSRWWGRLFKKDFSHCFALVRQDGLWVQVDPSLSVLAVNVLPVGVPLRKMFPDCAKFVRFKRWIPENLVRTPWLLVPLTCVEQMKSLLGVRNPLLLTPYQLFKHLEKSNG